MTCPSGNTVYMLWINDIILTLNLHNSISWHGRDCRVKCQGCNKLCKADRLRLQSTSTTLNSLSHLIPSVSFTICHFKRTLCLWHSVLTIARFTYVQRNISAETYLREHCVDTFTYSSRWQPASIFVRLSSQRWVRHVCHWYSHAINRQSECSLQFWTEKMTRFTVASYMLYWQTLTIIYTE